MFITKAKYFCKKSSNLKHIFFSWLLILQLLPVFSIAQNKDTALVSANKTDTVVGVSRPSSLQVLLNKNSFLNAQSAPVSPLQISRIYFSKDYLFYLLAVLVLMVGVLKLIYNKYFGNMFRVFFNSSLRQSQLTDQLLQAKLPSLLFNLLFFAIGGMYIYLVLNHFDTSSYKHWDVLLIATLCLMAVYIVKNIVLKFTGWLSGFNDEANTYIFIVFLLNKIIGLLLLPLIILIAFADSFILNIALYLSYLLIGSMLILRFIRSYGLLRHRLKVSFFHFALYIIGVELMPILLIYKVVVSFLSKSL